MVQTHFKLRIQFIFIISCRKGNRQINIFYNTKNINHYQNSIDFLLPLLPLHHLYNILLLVIMITLKNEYLLNKARNDIGPALLLLWGWVVTGE